MLYNYNGDKIIFNKTIRNKENNYAYNIEPKYCIKNTFKYN